MGCASGALITHERSGFFMDTGDAECPAIGVVQGVGVVSKVTIGENASRDVDQGHLEPCLNE